MIKHKKQFGLYHWDTFDNETILITKDWRTLEMAEFDTILEADAFVQEQYAGCISDQGADQVDIVDLQGNVVQSYRVC